MTHLESAFTTRNSFWRYLVMFAAILIVTNSIGAIPLIIALVKQTLTDPEVLQAFSADPNDISILTPDPNTGLFIMLFPFIAGLIAFIILIKPLNGRTLNDTINGGLRMRWNRCLISAFVWIVLSSLYMFLYLELDPSNFSLNNTTISLLSLAIISILFIPFQAAFEEILFRGYLMQGFSVLMRNRWFPLILTSVLFALMHVLNPEVEEFGFLIMMPHYVLFGLIFGIITILDDGIEAAIGAHAANNVFLCIMVTNESSALQTEALFLQKHMYPWIEFAGLIITGVIFIVILSLLFRWRTFSILFTKINP